MLSRARLPELPVRSARRSLRGCRFFVPGLPTTDHPNRVRECGARRVIEDARPQLPLLTLAQARMLLLLGAQRGETPPA